MKLILLIAATGLALFAISSHVNVKAQKINDREEHYHGLRNLALNMTPEKLRITLPNNTITVYGVIMDMWWKDNKMTITSFQTGDASVYFSTGGGLLGGGEQEIIRKAASAFILEGQNCFSKTTKAKGTPLPEKDFVTVYLLTNKGIYAATEKMNNITNKTSAFTKLYQLSFEIINGYRVSIEKNKTFPK